MRGCHHPNETPDSAPARITMAKVLAIMAIIIPLISVSHSLAALFRPSLPKGKEIDDPYLIQLFAPEFPCESIKVIETKKGKRYVIVKATEPIDDKAQNEYQFKTLASRNIETYSWGSEFSKRLLRSELVLYRVSYEMPYVIEYSKVEGTYLSDKPWSSVEGVIQFDNEYIIILVDKDFGRTFKTIVLYPKQDVDCPDPPFIGKYPNARKVACYYDKEEVHLFLITQDHKQAVLDYYKPVLKKHYDQLGFCYSKAQVEGTTYLEEYGLSQGRKRLMEVINLLSQDIISQDNYIGRAKQIMILNVRVSDITVLPAIKYHCLIKIRIGVDDIKVERIINNSKSYCNWETE